jgi:peptidoglycan/LPS O-acetylase OafA/YrhL
MKKLHFHSFDAFRFFAFLKVFLLHAPLIVVANSPKWMGWWNEHIRFGGGIGVSFFFVLSGFLITYILTVNKIHNGNISPKRFFIRRMFRIAPLYYLMVIMALTISPDIAKSIGFYMNGGGYQPEWIYSLTFTENIAMIINDNMPKTTPLSVFWSLCIEEQFYVYWMIVFFCIKRKLIPYFLVFSILTAIIFRIFGDVIFNTKLVDTVDLFSNLDYFSISGLLGYAVATSYEKVESFVNRIPLWMRWGYVGFVLLMLYFQSSIFEYNGWFLKVFWCTISATIFTVLLLVFIPQDSKIRISENNILTKLGKISYGLYVYHIVWIHLVYKFYKDYGIEVDGIRSYFVFIVTTFTMTVITSYFSYKYFEKPILGLREKYFSGRNKSIKA